MADTLVHPLASSARSRQVTAAAAAVALVAGAVVVGDEDGEREAASLAITRAPDP